MPKPRVLILEEELDLLSLYAYHLKRLGCRVLAVGSAEAGLAAARKHRPELIIIGLGIPGKDGSDYLHILKEKKSALVLFLTSRRFSSGLRPCRKGARYSTRASFISRLIACKLPDLSALAGG